MPLVSSRILSMYWISTCHQYPSADCILPSMLVEQMANADPRFSIADGCRINGCAACPICNLTRQLPSGGTMLTRYSVSAIFGACLFAVTASADTDSKVDFGRDVLPLIR